jgi:hypothetical protein
MKTRYSKEKESVDNNEPVPLPMDPSNKGLLSWGELKYYYIFLSVRSYRDST